MPVPPKIDVDNSARNPEVTVNSTTVLNCPVTGNPQPDILWYRNDVLLDATNHPRYEVVANGRQLRIYGTQVKDRGNFRCTARNRAGEDSLDFDLDVFGTLFLVQTISEMLRMPFVYYFQDHIYIYLRIIFS